jgi:hypothetical protein
LNLLEAQDHRQLLAALDPLPLKGLLVKKLQGIHLDPQGTAGQTFLFAQVKKEVPDLLFAELIRGPMVMAGELGDGIQVNFLRFGSQTP